MLHSWVEILPLFIVRILAKKYCEKLSYEYPHVGRVKVSREFAMARPDILVKF